MALVGFMYGTRLKGNSDGVLGTYNFNQRKNLVNSLPQPFRAEVMSFEYK
jgi:hypothetical protein